MKKSSILILCYALAVLSVIAIVKVVQKASINSGHQVLLADCNDAPPTTNPGE